MSSAPQKKPSAPVQKQPPAPVQKPPPAPGPKPPSAPVQKPPLAPVQKPPPAPVQKPPPAPGQKPPPAPVQKPPSAPGQKPPSAPGQKKPSALGQKKAKIISKLQLHGIQAAKAGSPLPPGPSTGKPAFIIDSNVAIDINQWKKTAGVALTSGTSGVVLYVGNESQVSQVARNTGVPVTGIIVPFDLNKGPPKAPPPFLRSPPAPISLSVSWTPKSSSNASLALGIEWALKQGLAVDIDVKWDVRAAESESSWEELLSILDQATKSSANDSGRKPITLTNVLPPPHSLTIPIVKLLSTPTYTSYQAHISDLSFISNLYLKFLPPSWTAPTPPSPSPAATIGQASSLDPPQDSPEKAEWKRRIKMFMTPALDAFGYRRILFGSSPSSSSTSKSTPNDWYAISREVIAEIGIEQAGIDCIFGGNAQQVYKK